MRKYIVLLVIGSVCYGCNNKSEGPVEEDMLTEKEVRDFVNDYDNMWAQRDTIRLKDAMAENYIYFTSAGSTTDRKKIISWFSPADKYIVDTAIRSEISITINGNTAVVSSRWNGSGSFEGEQFKDDQRCSLTIQKDSGKIKIVAEHCTQIVNQR